MILIKRDSSFDFLKSLAIFLVIWGHMMARGTHDIYHDFNGRWIVMINMPLFMFIVGYFSQSSLTRTWCKMLNNKFQSLLIPTFIFGCITFIPRILIGKSLINKGLWGGVETAFIEPYWFIWCILYCLIYTKGLYCFLKKYLSIEYILLLGWFLLMLIPNTCNFPIFSKTQSMYPFFILGLIFHRRELLKRIRETKLFWFLSGFILLLIDYLLYKPGETFYNFEYLDHQLWLWGYIRLLLGGISGVVVCYIISESFIKYERVEIKWINKVGQYTLAIYLQQTVIFSILNIINFKTGCELLIFIFAIAIYFTLALVTLWISKNRLLSKYILGKN